MDVERLLTAADTRNELRRIAQRQSKIKDKYFTTDDNASKGLTGTRSSAAAERAHMGKVADFGTNRKAICDFLLMINTNLPPISHRFQVSECRLLVKFAPSTGRGYLSLTHLFGVNS